jgi:hypothetical protein
MKNLKAIMVFYSIFSFFAISCTKRETAEVDNETQSVIDNSLICGEFISIVDAIHQHSLLKNTCDTLTRLSGDTMWSSSGHVQPVFQLNVNNQNCAATFPDGRYRSGLVKIWPTGRFNSPGTQLVLKLYNYKTGSTDDTKANKFECDSFILTTTSVLGNKTTYGARLVNGKCLTNGYTIRYSTDFIINCLANGAGIDATAEVSGSASGVNRHGLNFTVGIDPGKPLLKYRACQYVSSGKLEITPEGFKKRMVDYGDGKCEDNATFSVNSNTVAFKLK